MKPASNKRKCSICDSPKGRVIFKQRFSMISEGALLSGYDIVVCENCGFCYADNIPQQPAFDTYYREMSKYEHQDRGNQVSKYDMARFQSVVSILKRFLPNPDARILEIGCSTGKLLSLLVENGFDNVVGIDPSPACAEVAQRLYGIRVFTNTLFDAVVNAASIDVLIMVGVLEHIRDLNTALKKCWNILSDDAFIYIEVPDASCYAKGNDAPFQEFSLEHINFFGPVSLRNLMIANGFAQIYLEQSMVEANYRTTTPAICSIYQKSKTTISNALPPDPQTEASLRLYIGHSNQVDSQIQAAIASVVTAGRSIIVWGTGAHTLRLLATSKLGEAKIRAFVDSNPRYQGKQLNGIPIIAPVDLKGRPEPILISSRVFQWEIEQKIREDLRLSNQIIKLYEV